MARNAGWHEKHPTPRPATLAQRVRWHVAHARACGCRPMPHTVVVALEREKRARR